jgi:hypothetical protein
VKGKGAERMTIRGKIRRHNIIPSALLMSAAVAAGLGLSPATAHAAQTMSAVGSGWAVQQAQAIQNAEADAYGNLYDAAGYQPCTNVTYTILQDYQVPGAPYGFGVEAEATGTCP